MDHSQALGVLRRRGLSEEAIAALERQGFVCRERRGGGAVWKLRYRIAGAQRVRYLGSRPECAAEVEQALAALQRRHRQARELARLARETRALLRSGKERLERPLREAGYVFHGQAIRRPRRGVLSDPESD